jgi:hypothetical protein
MTARENRAAHYGAPLGIYIAKTKPECENTLNSTNAILTQIAGNAKWVLVRGCASQFWVYDIGGIFG